MRKLKVLFWVMVWLIVFSVQGWALGLEVSGGVWQANPSGNIAYKGDTLSTDDLGLDKKITGYGRIKIDLPLINFYIMATPIRFEGNGQKLVNFNFGGISFSANATFESELTINQYDLGVYWGIPFLKSATALASLGNLVFNVDFGLNVKVIDLYAKISQGTISKDKSLTIPVPMLYLGVGAKLWKFAVEAEGRGIAYSGYSFYDVIVRGKVMPISIPLVAQFFVEGGYRYQKVKLDDYKDINADFEFSGPFVGIGGAF